MMHNYQESHQQSNSIHLPVPWTQQKQLKIEPVKAHDSVQESGYNYSQQSLDHQLSHDHQLSQQQTARRENRRDPRLNLTNSHMNIHEVAKVIAEAEPVPNEGAPPEEFWLVGNCIKNVKADVFAKIIYIPDALLHTLIVQLKSQLHQTRNPPLVIFGVGPLDLVPQWNIAGVKERLLEFMLRLAGLRQELGSSVANVVLATIHPPSMKAGNHPRPADAQDVINEVFRLYNVFVYYFNNSNNMRTLRLDKAFTCHKEVFTLRHAQLDPDGIQPGESCAAIMSGRIAKYVNNIQQDWQIVNVSYASDSAGFEKNYTRVLKAEQKYLASPAPRNEYILPYQSTDEPHRKQMKLSNQLRINQPIRYPTNANNSYNEPVPLLSLDVSPRAFLSHEAASRPVSLSHDATLHRPVYTERLCTSSSLSHGEEVLNERVDKPIVNFNIEAARRMVSQMPEHLTPWIDRIYLQFLNTEKRIARIRDDEDRIRLQDFEQELYRLHPF